MSVAEILALTNELATAIPTVESVDVQPAGFAFLPDSDSSALGGCAETLHRRERAMELARFAALYSDVVYIPNYFSRYPTEAPSLDNQSELFLRERLVGDITIALDLKPCLTAKIMRFVQTRFHFCERCAADLAVDEKRVAIERAVRNAVARYSRRSHGTATIYDGFYMLKVDGPREVFPHPWSTIHTGKLGKQTRGLHHQSRMPATVQQVESEVRRIIGQAAFDVELQTILSRLLGTTYLTGRSIDVGLLRAVSGEAQIDVTDKLARDLACELPFLVDAPLDALVSLRSSEAESFAVCRSAIRKAAATVVGSPAISRKDVHKIYRDGIEPELNRLDLIVKRARNSRLTSGLKDAVITSGLLLAGVYAGFLPSHISEILKVTGGLKMASDLVKAVTERFTIATQIKENEFYFLWKVRHRQRKERRRGPSALRPKRAI